MIHVEPNVSTYFLLHVSLTRNHFNPTKRYKGIYLFIKQVYSAIMNEDHFLCIFYILHTLMAVLIHLLTEGADKVLFANSLILR